MSIPQYEIIIVEDSSNKNRIIICDDDFNIETWVRKGIDKKFEKLNSRVQLIDKYREKGWQTWLILDGTLKRKDNELSPILVDDAYKWCSGLEPALTAEEMAQSVVVWSGSPRSNHPFLSWYTKTSDPVNALRQIKNLCERTARGEINLRDWPKALMGVQEQLSHVIHAAHNLLVPIELDYHTIDNLLDQESKESWNSASGISKEDAQKITLDILRQYFLPNSDSYLSLESCVHQGMDIIGYIGSEKILKSLPERVQKKIKEKRLSFEKNVKKARSFYQNKDFRIKPEEVQPPFVKKLIEALYIVVSKGNEFLEKLRTIRDNERKKFQNEA